MVPPAGAIALALLALLFYDPARREPAPVRATVPTTPTVARSVAQVPVPGTTVRPSSTTAPPTTTVPPTTTSAPVASTTQAPVALSLDLSHQCQDDVEILIRRYFGDQADTAVRIAWRESNCRPDVASSVGALGVFQLYGHDDLIAAHGGSWADPETNVAAAYDLWRNCGWGPWTPPYSCG